MYHKIFYDPNLCSTEWPASIARTFKEKFETDLSDVFEDTVKLLVWISRRYYEIKMFQNFQRAANGLYSLSSKELIETAQMFLHQLFFGSVNTCRIEERIFVRAEVS